MTALSRILFSLCVLSTFVALLLIARTENVESIPKLDCSWIPSVQPTDTWFLKESSEEVCGGCTFGEVSKLDGTLTIFCSPDSQPHYDLDDDIGLRPYTGPINIGNSEFVVVHCNTQNDPRTNKTCNINRELIVRNAYNQTIHHNAQQRFIHKKDNVQKQNDTQTTNKLDFLPNIMLLMFDSASMKHAHRRIPNTIQYLHHLNTSAESGVKVFEMQKYNVVGLNSPANFLGFLTGHPHADDLHTESMMYPVLRYLLNDRQKMSPFKTAVDSYDKWIWSQLHKHGYISMFSEGICFDKTLRVMGFSDNIKETYDTDLFGYKPFNYPTRHLPGLDYFFHNAWCQEDNKLMNIYEKTHSHDDKPKCVCLGRKFAHEQTFDYLDEFYRNYPDVPKFSFTAFQEPHDRTMQIFGSMDLSLRDYLMHLNAGWNVTKPYHATSEPFRAPSILQESIVIMFADHGMNFGDYALKQSEGWLEHKQPEMLISVPTSILDKFPEIGDALAHNSHSLLTAYDLFATLMHIPVYPDPPTLANPQIAQSLFTKIDSARTCEDAYIPDEYCAEKVEKHEVCWQSGHSCEVAAENGRQRFVWDLMQKELDWDPESGDPEPIHVLPEVHLVMHVRHVQMVVDIVCIVLGVTLLFLIGRLLVFL